MSLCFRNRAIQRSVEELNRWCVPIYIAIVVIINIFLQSLTLIRMSHQGDGQSRERTDFLIHSFLLIIIPYIFDINRNIEDGDGVKNLKENGLVCHSKPLLSFLLVCPQVKHKETHFTFSVSLLTVAFGVNSVDRLEETPGSQHVLTVKRLTSTFWDKTKKRKHKIAPSIVSLWLCGPFTFRMRHLAEML